jgi:hypothetical protein
MSKVLFEQHLAATMPGQLRGSDTPFLDSDVQDLVEVFTAFQKGLDTSANLSDEWTAFCEFNELDANEIEYLEQALLGSTQHTIGTEEIDKADVGSFLASLNKPFPKPNQTFPNQDCMSPLAGELGIKKFLRRLPVSNYPEPYGNQLDKDVKVFDRQANRYGHPYEPFNDQRPSRSLANPTINVDTDNKAFEAVDSIGMGSLIHWRVKNNLTGKYVTRQIYKESAIQMAAELNRDFEQMLAEEQLDEGYPSRKHFTMVANTVRAIEDPKKRQELADHHASIFASQNPRFDHKRFHDAAGTRHNSAGVKNESITSANSSGQGVNKNHVHHPLHATLQQHGFSYSHSTPIHQRNGDSLMNHAWAHGERKVDAYDHDLAWTSKTSSASGHSHSGTGVAELAKHLKGKAKRYPELKLGEENLPSLAIQESLLQPLDPAREARYSAAFQQQNYKKEQDQRYLESAQRKNATGNVTQSDSPASAWQKTQTLINERRKHEPNELSEQNVIRSKTQVRRASERTELEETSRAENHAFLDKLNTDGSGTHAGTVSGSYDEKKWGKI